jgi:hypothetical protein
MPMPRTRLPAAILFCCTLALISAVRAADHLDSPLPATNRPLDITDVYVFRSPANAANLVIAANHQSVFDFVGSSVPGPLFADDASYETYIDRDGDSRADVTIKTTFENGASRFKVQGLAEAPISGEVTPVGRRDPIVTVSGPVKVFCGPRDDPFFFDLVAFNQFFGPGGPYLPAAGLRRDGAGAPQNFFQGNVASIVIEAPATLLSGAPNANGGTIRVWSKTFRVRS